MEVCVIHHVLTVEQAQLQQGSQGRDDHEHEEAPPPAHQPHGRAQRHAGRHRDARHGVIVCVEVVEHGGLLDLGVHHAASEAVVDPVACEPAWGGGGGGGHGGDSRAKHTSERAAAEIADTGQKMYIKTDTMTAPQK